MDLLGATAQLGLDGLHPLSLQPVARPDAGVQDDYPGPGGAMTPVGLWVVAEESTGELESTTHGHNRGEPP